MSSLNHQLVFRRIGHKILAVVGLTVTVGLAATAAFYAKHQEQAVLAQNERTMQKLTESVIQGLQSVMVAGYADIAQAFADRLKKVPEVQDFRILRTNGLEAFRDNSTIKDVNRRRGEEIFFTRDNETEVRVMDPNSADFRRALESDQPVSYYETNANGERQLTFLAPIVNQDVCYKCHGKSQPLRGVLKLTTSLAPVERDILQSRQQSLLVLGVVLMGTLLLTGYMLGRAVVRPIESVTSAMMRASGGDLEQKVPVSGQDELSQMAGSFNFMTAELQKTYLGLQHEQDKLTTIIHGAGEGIVVTDAEGVVVLVNPAAERLLDKPLKQIVGEGFMALLDDPATMSQWLEKSDGEAHVIQYKGRVLQVNAATIHNNQGGPVGSAALVRDITEQKRLEEELRKLATTDGLTGLYNRRHLDETLKKELTRARRYHTPLSVLFFDVDHFKQFNDTHGHDMGDRVLEVLGKTFRDALRNHDVPCRYGGEEFLAILPNTNQAGAYAVAERFRKEVEALQIDGLKVTVSIGVASVPDLQLDNADQLVEAADRALYEAKAGGRNRVRIAESPVTGD